MCRGVTCHGVTAGLDQMQLRFFVHQQLSFDAECQSHVRARNVARAQADCDRAFEVFEGAQNHLIEQLGRRTGRSAIEHLAEDDAAHALHLAGLAQLPEHAVDLIGLGADIFKEEQLAFGLRLVGGAQQSHENAQAAAIECAASPAGVQGAHALGCAYNVGLAAERSLQTGQMNAIFTR